MILAGFQTWFDRILDHLGMLEGDVRTVAVSFVIAFAVRQALVLILAIVLAWRFFATGGRSPLEICHVGCFIARPATDALVSKRMVSQKELVADSPRHIDSTTSTYSLICRIGNGDVCDVHYGLARQKCDSAVGQVCNLPFFQRLWQVENLPHDSCRARNCGSAAGGEYVLKVPRGAGTNNLLAKEREVLEQLSEQSGDGLYHEYFPEPVETFRVDRRRVNVFPWREGFYSAEQIIRQHPDGLDGRHLAWMFNRTLEAIGYAHSRGWIHGAVLPPHLLFHAENHGLQLVGWVHAEPVGRPLRFAPTRFKEWYPPECRLRQPVTPSVDIYLAAKSLVYLSGGDPLGNMIPERIPAGIRRFLKGCLLESPGMRPQDAWETHHEFSELLEGVYGPPEYHCLVMS